MSTLLVWNDLGMHCVSDCDPWFVILPPANNLEAQLIHRGETPELVSEGITLTYSVDEKFKNPSNHPLFWDYSLFNFGVTLEKNVGLAGLGMKGEFEFDEDINSFIAPKIPVMPYQDDNIYNPYPLFTIEAVASESERILATTKVVTPVSTEMGCRNCYGGKWRWNDNAGVANETAVNILKAHDRGNRTDLYSGAVKGEPHLCQSCHEDPALESEGNPEVLNFSAAMHGWHANYITGREEDACMLCHPSFSSGRTRCLRGVHNTVGVTCIDCHGTLEDHALSLLNGQKEKPASQRLSKNIKPRMAEKASDIQPMQYSGMPYPIGSNKTCSVCHIKQMQFPIHHENMSRYVRNKFE